METVNDPFNSNATPWWMAPNVLCGSALETERQQSSDALGGAYSYPDASVLTSLLAPQNAGCQ